jgi:hypothetical protein
LTAEIFSGRLCQPRLPFSFTARLIQPFLSDHITATKHARFAAFEEQGETPRMKILRARLYGLANIDWPFHIFWLIYFSIILSLVV